MLRQSKSLKGRLKMDCINKNCQYKNTGTCITGIAKEHGECHPKYISEHKCAKLKDLELALKEAKNMNLKEFYGSISFSGRINFGVKANDEESAKNIVINDIEMYIKSGAEDILDVSDVEWDLILQAPRGNMATSFVSDFEIYEEE